MSAAVDVPATLHMYHCQQPKLVLLFMPIYVAHVVYLPCVGSLVSLH